jgi:protein kinase
MEERINNNKRDSFLLRECLHRSKKGSTIYKAITKLPDGKYGFFIVKRIPIDINDHHSIKSYIDNFEINNEDIIKYMLNIIENTKKYYKNKEIKLFLI